ncbi:MAG: monoheme cytochrome c [Selenomonadaceae bacterium]|nr:monoheme cytochrome c [Selenomonadaceae bacterium]
MCNLSDGIEQRGINIGVERGKSDMVLAMLKDNQPLELIVKFSNFTKEKIVEIGRKNSIIIG